MATFRAQQIDEILNYDRAMNRIVLDNEIGQATRFNDQRNPPTNRDIKFEALLGTLIDAMKAKIAEALTSIASQQYPKTDAVKVSGLLGLPSGDRPNEASFKNMNSTAIKKALKAENNYKYNAKIVADAEKKLGFTPDDAEDEEAEEADEADGQDLDKTGGPEVQKDEVAVTPADATKFYNPYANQMFAFGKPSRKRKFMLRGGVETANAETQSDRTGAEVEKSVKQQVNATENILYEIINQYNAIVDKILQTTQPDGRFASRRNNSSSQVGYFADVLKGVNKPLKHLVFELTQVHKPELSTVLNMMRSLVDIIDMSPPFQKISVEAYKSGVPDFQGLTNETQYINADGYIADLKAYLKKVEGMVFQAEHQVQAVMFNTRDRKLQDSIQKSLEKRRDDYKQLAQKVRDEIEKTKARKEMGEELDVNASVIKYAEDIYESLEKLLINGPNEVQEYIQGDLGFEGDTPFMERTRIPVKSPDELDVDYLKKLEQVSRRVNRRLKNIEKYEKTLHTEKDPEDAETEGDFTQMITDLEKSKNRLVQQKNRAQKAIETARKRVDIAKRLNTPEQGDTADAQYAHAPPGMVPSKGRITLLKTSPGLVIPGTAPGVESYAGIPGDVEDLTGKELTALAQQLGVSMVRSPGRTNEVIKDEIRGKLATQMGFQVQMPKTAPAPEAPKTGKGGAGGLATLLASRKPQYWNHREDQQYDFDRQHNESMKNAREWQAKSNPPHTTPVGSLYPFYKKDPASMYSFPLKLKHDNAKLYPDDTQKDARGADVSLLQGPVGGPSVPVKRPAGRKPTVTHRTASEATQNIIQGKGKKKNPKALHKLLFNDEANDPYEENETHNEGMVHSESEEEDHDRFRNKKLGPVKNKKKSAKK